MPASKTAKMPLLGAAPREELDGLATELAGSTGLDEERTRRAGRPPWHAGARRRPSWAQELDLLRPLADDGTELEAEVAWAVEQELALGLDDVLSRRMRLSMSRRDRGASHRRRARPQIMGDRLGWDADRQAAEVEAYLAAAHREYDVPGA